MPDKLSRKEIGNIGEQIALKFLNENGYKNAKIVNKLHDIESDEGIFEVKTTTKKYRPSIPRNQYLHLIKNNGNLILIRNNERPIIVPSNIINKVASISDLVVIKVQKSDKDRMNNIKLHRTEPKWSIIERALDCLETEKD